MPPCESCHAAISKHQAETTKKLLNKELCPDCARKESAVSAEQFMPVEVEIKRYLEKRGFEEQKMVRGLWLKGELPNRGFVDLSGCPDKFEVGVLTTANKKETEGHGIIELDDIRRELGILLKSKTGGGNTKNEKTPVPNKEIGERIGKNAVSESPTPFNQETQEQTSKLQNAVAKKTATDMTLTKELLDKMPFEQVMLNFQSTPSQFIKHRPGRGNQDLAYVEGWYMKQVINLATKWKWSSKIDGWKETPTEIICWGSITITLPDGSQATQSGVGSAEIKMRKGTKEPVSLGDDYKAAMTDMEKKAISKWGIASDVYRGDVEVSS